jgi:hypothetical protein
MLHMTYHWLIILLHRPFYRRRRICEDLDNYTDHIKVCDVLVCAAFVGLSENPQPCNKSAAEIMDLAKIWRDKFKLRYVPITMIQVISAAATIFVVAAVQAVSGPRIAHGALELAENNAALAIQYLREIGESFASATNVADILQNLIYEQVQTRKARRSPRASPRAMGHSPTMGSWPFSNSLPTVNVSGPSGGPNAMAASSWMGLIGTPFDGYPDAQNPMSYSDGQYSSSLAGALGANYHPFGDGVGESLYFPPAVILPGMGVESMVRGDSVVTGDSMMMPRSSQVAPYAYQMGAPAHPPQH